MAFAGQLGPLVEDLVKAHTDDSTGKQIEHLKRISLRTFANDRSGRINQFEISSRLQGLVEKCRILNRDTLGNAIQVRLEELSSKADKWTPEVLSLLLQLSDRPVHKTKVEDLELIQPASPPAPLTWSDIVADDPLEDQTALWQDIDFAADSSDENDDVETAVSESSEYEQDSGTFQTVDSEASFDGLTVPVTDQGLREITDAQFWKEGVVKTLDHDFPEEERKPKLMLTELQAIREVIFMLLSLPTSVYVQRETKMLMVSSEVRIGHAFGTSMTGLLNAFAEIGDKILALRDWAQKSTNIPLEQTFQAAIASRLQIVDGALFALQTRILNFSGSLVHSLLELYNEVCQFSRLLQQLHIILVDSGPIPESSRPFRILECLFDRTCINQSLGDDEGYRYMAEVFFDCFQTYLRPMRRWMESGEISTQDHVMFIRKSEGNVSLHSLWQDQYQLIYDSNGGLHAPRFLHLSAKKIFNTGKSVDFLGILGYDKTRGTTLNSEPAMTFKSVCQTATMNMLCPFSELFNMSLDRWIASKHHSSSTRLHQQLESQCGLRKSLDALEHIFFCRNGALSGNATTPVFEKIDRGKRWNDSFTLIELFQGAFAAVPCIDVDRLGVYSGPHVSQDRRSDGRSMNVLETLRVTYLLPWPVANIIRPNSLRTYQRIFILLTQIHRAKHLLERRKFPRHSSSPLLYAIRTRLLWFTNTILIHLTAMVLSINTTKLRSDLARAEDVDAMIALHAAYVAQLEDQCFLAKQNASLRQAIISILDLTILFSDLQAEVSGSSLLPLTAAIHKGPMEDSSPSSDEESDDYGVHEVDEALGHRRAAGGLHFTADSAKIESKLLRMQDTFTQLLGFISAAVQNLNKADGGTIWEVLASHLALGLRT